MKKQEVEEMKESMPQKFDAGARIWGLALAWYPSYTDGYGEDPWLARLAFLRRYGMKALSAGLKEIDEMEENRRTIFFEMLERYDMHCVLHVDLSHMEADSSVQEKVIQDQLKLLERYAAPCRSPIVTSCAGESHRYDRRLPWSEKIARFSHIMTPIAVRCWDMGRPFCIENHADYFVSDFLEILTKTPRLQLFLDTANALHIGEHPLRACEEAAPYVVGTHFKDHAMVRGTESPLHYEIRGCALGDGDAMLEAQYHALMKASAFRDRLVMLFELFAPEDGSMPPLACFERSVEFVRRIIV